MYLLTELFPESLLCLRSKLGPIWHPFDMQLRNEGFQRRPGPRLNECTPFQFDLIVHIVQQHVI